MKSEEGNGCLVLILLVVLLFAGCGIYFAASGPDDSCTTTGEPGSAQYERDYQNAIKGDC